MSENSIIPWIKEYPCLYNKNDPHFKDLNKRNIAWAEISKLSKLSIEDCRLQWRNIRSRFCKIKKKKHLYETSGKPIIISDKTMEFIKQMDFMNKIVVTQCLEAGNKELKIQKTGKKESEYISLQTQSAFPNTQWSQTEKENLDNVKLSPSFMEHIDNFIDISTSKNIVCNNSVSDTLNIPNEFLSILNTHEFDLIDPKTGINDSSNVNYNNADKIIIKTLWDIVHDLKLETTNNKKEDTLFALSLVENLSKFPPKKKNLIKGEILLLLSKFDDTEIN